MEFQDNQEPGTSKFSYSRFGIKSIFIIILIFLSGSIIYSALTLLFKQSKYEIIIVGIIELIFIFIPTYYFAKKSPLGIKSALRLDKYPDIKHVVIGILGLLSLQIFVTCYFPVQESLVPGKYLLQYQEMMDAYEKAYQVMLTAATLPELFLILLSAALIPAICEEMAFRGLLQRSLEQEWLPIRAITFSSIIFAILHMNPLTLIPLLVIGFYLGFLAYSSQSLYLVIIIHFLHNAIAIIAGFQPYLKNLDNSADKLEPVTAVLLCFTSLLLAAFAVYYLFVDRINKSNLPELQ